MIQREVPFPSIFMDTHIKLKLKEQQRANFICSLDKNFIGVGKPHEIRVYKLNNGKWKEYFKRQSKHKLPTQLICFYNNDNSILSYTPSLTNSIQCINLQLSNFLSFPCISGTIETFYQFQSFESKFVLMNSSNDQKLIMIKSQSQYLVFNVIKKEIITKFEIVEDFSYYNNISFWNNHFVMENTIYKWDERRRLEFYDIRNSNLIKAKKRIHQVRTSYPTFFQLNDCKLLAYTNVSESLYCFGKLCNLVNLKIIRKIIIQHNSTWTSFIGFTEKYLMHSSGELLYKIDLFILQVETIPISKEQDICVKNQILMIKEKENNGLFNIQFYITK